MDSGNCVPGSAVISEALLVAMGVQDLLITTSMNKVTANKEGQPLQVIGKLRHLYMAVSDTLILHLHHITVASNLSHPLNLGGFFLPEFVPTGSCPAWWCEGSLFPCASANHPRQCQTRAGLRWATPEPPAGTTQFFREKYPLGG